MLFACGGEAMGSIAHSFPFPTSHAQNLEVLTRGGAPQPLHSALVIILMKNIWITQLNGRIAAI